MDTNISKNVIAKIENPNYEYKCNIPVKWNISQCDVSIPYRSDIQTSPKYDRHYVILRCTTTNHEKPDCIGSFTENFDLQHKWFPVADEDHSANWYTEIRFGWNPHRTPSPNLAFYNAVNKMFQHLKPEWEEYGVVDYDEMIGQLTLATFHAVCDEEFPVCCGCHLMDIWEFLWDWGYYDTYNDAVKVAERVGNQINEYLRSSYMKYEILQILDRNCKQNPSAGRTDVYFPARKMGTVGFIGWTEEDIIKLIDTAGYKSGHNAVLKVAKELKNLYESLDTQFDISCILADACEQADMYIENPAVYEKEDRALSPDVKEDFLLVFAPEKQKENL